MTTQVSIFEAVNDNTGQVKRVISTADFHGQPLDIYGDFENPLFMARDIAEMIDYSKTNQGKWNVAKMIKMVDEDEKIKGIPNGNTLINSGTKVWFLTEHGLYEVLMQSRKPIAKEFKKMIKQVLKEIRLNGYYMAGEIIQEHPANQALPVISDLTYIKNKLAELVDMDSLSDINDGLARVKRLVEVIGGT
ncbi:Uncharacterized phage-encoded protein [Chlamydia trachomatis]|nr:Uncharacterized phage-encoded protein [Chlamydia trachomatis]